MPRKSQARIKKTRPSDWNSARDELERTKGRNAYNISAKLPEEIYRPFWRYCQQHDLLINAAIIHLFSTHPDLHNG